MDPQEETKLLRELEARAKSADPDTEEKLRRLDAMAEARRKDPVLETRYEKLRDEMSAQLLADGPRYYLDARGTKRIAFAVQPEPVEVNVSLLIRMHEEGLVSDNTFNKVAPRKIDKEAFRREAAAGRLTQPQVARLAKITKGTPHVRFTDPIESR